MENNYSNLKGNIMKYKSINGYLGGGYMPNRYQDGGGVSNKAPIRAGNTYSNLRSGDTSWLRNFLLQKYTDEKQEEALAKITKSIKRAKEREKNILSGGKFLGKIASLVTPNDMAWLKPITRMIGQATGEWAGKKVSGSGAFNPGAKNYEGWGRGQLGKVLKSQQDFEDKGGDRVLAAGADETINLLKSMASDAAMVPKAAGAGAGADVIPDKSSDLGASDTLTNLAGELNTNLDVGMEGLKEVDTSQLTDSLADYSSDELRGFDLAGINKQDGGKVSLRDYTGNLLDSTTTDSLQQALVKKPMIDFFTRTKMKNRNNIPYATIQNRVLSGKLEPSDALNMLLNFEKMNYMRTKKDTANILFDRLKESGYQDGGMVEDNLMNMKGGGLINPMSYARRIV